MEYLISKKFFLLYFSFLIVICGYAYVGYTSNGFDDEFFNIWIVENFKAFEILYLDGSINSDHPNGSLFFNSILYKALGDWSLIRAFTGIFFAASLCLSYVLLSRDKEHFYKVVFFILLCLNPSLLILGTSLRWYSIFFILVNFLIILIYKNPKNPWTFWLLFFFLTILLVNLNYIAFLVVPILFLYSVFQRRRKIKSEIPFLISYVFFSLTFSLNQISDFIYKFSTYGSEQLSTLFISLLGFGLFQTSGLASIPISFSGLILVAVFLMLFIALLINYKSVPKKFLYIYLGFSSFLIFTGIGGKFRNFYFLHLMDSYIKANIISTLPRKYGILIITLLVSSFLIGSYNSISHNNTMKGSWNLPYQETIGEVKKIEREFDCNQIIIFNHDFGLSWHLNNNGYQTFNAYNQDNWKQTSEKSTADCQIYLSTFIGSMEKIRKKSLDDYFQKNDRYVKRIDLKKDKYANFKKILNEEIPDYYVELTFLKGK